MEKLTANIMKKLAKRTGADLCGIASVDRFNGAPEGFRPKDIFPATESVVVVVKRFPLGALRSKNPIPYSFAGEVVRMSVQKLICDLSLRLQEMGISAVPVPSEPYMYWNEERKEGKGILSLRHAGYLAGLGVLGRNTLLINEKYGNCISLGALLLDAPLESDPIATYKVCEDDCNACIKSCPVNALDGKSVVQGLCRERSQMVTPRGYEVYMCNKCRVICPNCRGVRQKK